jgi:hypothetical protein
VIGFAPETIGVALIVPAETVVVDPVAFAVTGNGVVDPAPVVTKVHDLVVSVAEIAVVVQEPIVVSKVNVPDLLDTKPAVQVIVDPTTGAV